MGNDQGHHACRELKEQRRVHLWGVEPDLGRRVTGNKAK